MDKRAGISPAIAKTSIQLRLPWRLDATNEVVVNGVTNWYYLLTNMI
jgi:hypothetical protein